MARAKEKELNLAGTAEVLGLGCRQTRLIWERYAVDGTNSPGAATNRAGDRCSQLIYFAAAVETFSASSL